MRDYGHAAALSARPRQRSGGNWWAV